jgi:hypothetical protein
MSLFSGQTINADSIFLTNDYVIYGKVVAFKPDATKYQVRFNNGGWLLLNKNEVKKIIVNDRDQFDEAEKRK